MSEAIELLSQASVLRPLDVQFAAAMARLASEQDTRVILAAALASWAVGQGHVCADLPKLREEGFVGSDEQPLHVALPGPDEWLSALAASRLVATDADAARPLFVDPQGRVYLQRYARYQRRVADAIGLRARSEELGYNKASLKAVLDNLFAGFDPQQRRAAACATRHRFCLISGGPGTGKTTTAVRVLATLQQLAMDKGEPLKMRMAAPTGKAAQRLGESVSSQLPKLGCSDELLATLPTTASTVHRLLGYQPNRPDAFRYNRRNRLLLDVLLVDEVSMLDLVLMAKLFSALEDHARVIFLGDKDQLASVQLGAVVGDIHAASQGSSLASCVVHLTKSHRYSEASGIGLLARAINCGDSKEALAVCSTATSEAAARLYDYDEKSGLQGRLAELVLAGFKGLWEDRDPQRRLALLDRFRVLCVNRKGPLGVETLNRQVQRYLASKLKLKDGSEFKDGRPIMVLQNDYRMRLFNGDIGVCCQDEDGSLGVYFQVAEGLRRVPYAQLPRHESVFAMTVHKSQGSEVDHVALVLPRADSPLASRELLYTAVTRARKKVSLFGSAEALQGAVQRRVRRSSGLVDLLRAY